MVAGDRVEAGVGEGAMRIFISYRREDSSAWAGRLRDALAARFGDDEIFFDVVTVRPGRDFTDAIRDAVRRADATLAVIGPRWLTATGADGRPRLADPDDHVRSELLSALEESPVVVPVLVGGASMPTAAQLPDGLEPLALRQAVTLRDETWLRDLDDLVRALPARRRPANRNVVVALALLGLLLVGGAALLLARLGGSDDESSATATSGSPDATSPGATGAGASSATSSASSSGTSTTAFDPTSRLPECPRRPAPPWTPLGVSGAAELGAPSRPSGRVEVVDGAVLAQSAGRWLVVLDVRFTNRAVGSNWHYWWFYELAIGDERVEPECFSVVSGQDPAPTGETNDALVGFVVSTDPAGGGALLIDDVGDRGRIDLSPS